MDGQPAVREVMLLSGADVDRGWVRVPLAGTDGAIQFSDLARFQPKMLFGDPSKDDNDLLSSWQISNLSGGHGVYTLKEGTDEGRYSFSTMITRYPAQFSRGYYIEEPSVIAAGVHQVLGDMYCATPDRFSLIVSVGTTLYKCSSESGTISPMPGSILVNASAPGMTIAPTARGQGFSGAGVTDAFYVPMGTSGYAWISEASAAANNVATPKFRAFTVYDNKLLGVTTGGRIYWTADAAPPVWTAYDITFQLPRQYYIRDILTFYDRRDEPAVFVLTEREMFQFDPDGPELFPIDFEWPSHGRRVQAAAVWQGQLFIAIGMGVFRYSGGTWMAVGLDRDDGIPVEYRGYITDLAAGYNGLYALVRGEDKSGGSNPYGAKSSVHEFSGSGWSCIWAQDVSQNANTIPTSDQYHGKIGETPVAVKRLVTSRSSGSSGVSQNYSLNWDRDTGGAQGMDLPIDWANPRAGTESGTDFGIGYYYYWESGWFDADMYGYTKIANACQFTIEHAKSYSTPSGETFRLLYRADQGTWTLLWQGRMEDGRYTAPFGTGIAIDTPAPGHPETTLYTGMPFEKIQLRWEITGQSNNEPAMITNFALSFLKTVSSNDSFTLTVNCTNGSTDGQLSPQELTEWIDALTSADHFGLMRFGPYTYRVFTAQNGGVRFGSDSQQGMRSLSIVEIPAQF